ncbi:MAG: hypothetical protein O7E51_16565 [Acidobacteria bacterium]|nr:hypothetical protein [Acidobacteriota bacterium]
MRLVLISFLLLTAPVFVHAQAIPNPNFRETAAIPFFHKLNSNIVSFQTFYKKVLDEQYTLLLIRGGAPIPEWRSVSYPMPHFWWNRDDLLGLFLAETANPDRIWELAILKSNNETSLVGVDRADSRSIVLWRTVSDYGIPGEWLKFFFDTQTKRLLQEVKYSPVAVGKIVRLSRRSVPMARRGGRLRQYFVGNSGKKPLVAVWERTGPVLVRGAEEQEVLAHVADYVQQLQDTGPSAPYVQESAYLTDHRDASITFLPIDSAGKFFFSFGASQGSRVAERTEEGYKLYPLPQSSLGEHRRARPERDEQQGRVMDWTIEERIGPYQIVGERFWFAKTFNDGEGYSGVGGVGYFDPEQKKYVIFSPPALAPWSSSAVAVAGDAVWVGLIRDPEGGDYSGGLLRYELATGSTQKYELKEIVLSILPFGPFGDVYVGTTNGIYVLHNGQFQRYVMEPDLSGEFRVIAASPPE